jgi:hypothetical protein
MSDRAPQTPREAREAATLPETRTDPSIEGAWTVQGAHVDSGGAAWDGCDRPRDPGVTRRPLRAFYRASVAADLRSIHSRMASRARSAMV